VVQPFAVSHAQSQCMRGHGPGDRDDIEYHSKYKMLYFLCLYSFSKNYLVSESITSKIYESIFSQIFHGTKYEYYTCRKYVLLILLRNFLRLYLWKFCMNKTVKIFLQIRYCKIFH